MAKIKINKKEPRVRSTSPKKELPATERHFGVILEDIDSKLGLVVEAITVSGKAFSKD